MTTSAPTFSQIRAQVAAIRNRKHGSNERAYGIYSTGRWSGPTEQRYGDELFHVIQCDSPLAMRLALQTSCATNLATVLVTSLPAEDLSEDIRVRLAGRKLYPIKNWQIIKELFQAKQLDARVTEHAWIAQRLVDLAPPSDYPPVASGILDAETVWGVLLEQLIGLRVARPDLIALLKWSMLRENVDQFRSETPEFRQEAGKWISECAGVAAEAILSCVNLNSRPDALPIGLALSAVFANEARGSLTAAAVRIEERLIGAGRLNERVANDWSKAATEVVRLHIPAEKSRSEWLTRADEILVAIEAHSHAYLSRTSPLGFEQRLAAFGRELSLAVNAHATDFPEAARTTYARIFEHEQATWHSGSRRLRRVEMAARLLRWLAPLNRDGARHFRSLSEACRWHALEGGFVDWARYSLHAGEQSRELAEAYGRLLSRVSEICETQNSRFAELLRDWAQAGATGDEVLPVERVQSEVVAPLAAHAPLLVLVIDGMSFAVFRELMAEITKQDWTEARRGDRMPIWPAIATLPSLTEVSRTSLMCGELRQGNQGDERSCFESHFALVNHSRHGLNPKLFHKSALQGSDETTLASEVISEIESSRRRIVGVVINAVDDHLLKGDQLDIRWTPDEIKVLPALLSEAKAAGRVIVLLSDHGHILDRNTRQMQHEGGDRWRRYGTPLEGEIAISAPRVVIPDEHTLIVPWTERIRYGMKKNGYHGGATLQEMVAPMAVLCTGSKLPEGWIESPVDAPDWWFEPTQGEGPPELPNIDVPTTVHRPSPGMLFNLESETPLEEQPAGSDSGVGGPTWLVSLFSSPVFKEQKRLGGRAVPNNELIQMLLEALGTQGGKLTSAALARKMQLPRFRLNGVVAAIQRILNVEGFPILVKDDASDTIELKLELLCRQFGLLRP